MVPISLRSHSPPYTMSAHRPRISDALRIDVPVSCSLSAPREMWQVSWVIGGAQSSSTDGDLLKSAPYLYPLGMTKTVCELAKITIFNKWENPLDFSGDFKLAMFIYQILYNQTPWIMAGNTTTTHLKIQSSMESRGEMVVARSASTCFASCALSLWWPSPAWPPRMRRETDGFTEGSKPSQLAASCFWLEVLLKKGKVWKRTL